MPRDIIFKCASKHLEFVTYSEKMKNPLWTISASCFVIHSINNARCLHYGNAVKDISHTLLVKWHMQVYQTYTLEQTQL